MVFVLLPDSGLQQNHRGCNLSRSWDNGWTVIEEISEVSVIEVSLGGPKTVAVSQQLSAFELHKRH